MNVAMLSSRDFRIPVGPDIRDYIRPLGKSWFPPMIVRRSLVDSFTGPIAPGELRMVDCRVDDLAHSIFWIGPDCGEFEEEDFIASMVQDYGD